MASTPRQTKGYINYPNGNCSCIVEIDYINRIFKIVETETNEFTTAEDIKSLYETSSAYCLQQIQNIQV